MNLLLLKFFVSSIAASQCRVDARAESSLTIQKYFIKVLGDGKCRILKRRPPYEGRQAGQDM